MADRFDNQTAPKPDDSNVDGVPAVIADPSQHAPAAIPAPPAPEPAPEPVVAEPVDERTAARNAIAEKFKARRDSHDSQFAPDHVPPFIANPVEPAAPPPAADAPPVAAPPAASPYVLKVLGREVPVATRADLLRLAEIEPHEEDGITDSSLIKIAQKNQAALARLDEAKQLRDQARVAPLVDPQHAPATPENPTPAPANNPTLKELQAEAIRAMQYEDAEIAAQAMERYQDARDEHRDAQRSTQTRQQTRKQEVDAAVVEFAKINPDIVAHPMASDSVLMTATREMESDLRAVGLTDQDLRGVLSNPALMTQAFNAARDAGLAVRTPDKILEAVGTKVRQAFNLPGTGGAPQVQTPQPPSRFDEKRQLTAQPTRSGTPSSTPAPQLDIVASRKAAIAKMNAARTAPNVRQ